MEEEIEELKNEIKDYKIHLNKAIDERNEVKANVII
jgi:hypothetical protein